MGRFRCSAIFRKKEKARGSSEICTVICVTSAPSRLLTQPVQGILCATAGASVADEDAFSLGKKPSKEHQIHRMVSMYSTTVFIGPKHEDHSRGNNLLARGGGEEQTTQTFSD